VTAIAANAATPYRLVSEPGARPSRIDTAATEIQAWTPPAVKAAGPVSSRSAAQVHVASCCQTLAEGPAVKGKRKGSAISVAGDAITTKHVVITGLRI